MRKTTLLWLLLAVFCSAILFHTSQQVTDGKARLASLQNKTQDEEESIRVLQAEWSYLNQPARLEKLVKEYLALEPMQGRQFAKLADIAEKEPEAVVPEVVAVAETVETVEEKPVVAVAPKPVIAKPAPVVAKVVTKTVTKTVAVKTPAPVIKIQKPVETPIVASNLPKTLIPVAAVPPKQVPVTKQVAAAKPTETRTKFTNSTQRKFGDVMQSLGLE